MESPILNDYVFKRVFGQKDDAPVLISFLNAMLNDEYNIKGVEIINSFQNDPIIREFNFRSRKNASLYLPLNELKIYPVELKKGTAVKDLTPKKETWINFLRTSCDVREPRKIDEIHNAYDRMLKTTGASGYRAYVEACERSERVKQADVYRARQEAEKLGIEKGMAQSIAQGLEKGKNEGKTIGMHNAKIETAKNMLSDGLSDDQITKYTGLSLEEIEKIKE